MRPGYLNGFTLGSILEQNTRLFGEIPPLAKDTCEGRNDPRHVENTRREKELRRRFQNCRKKLESKDWDTGKYILAAKDRKKALALLEKAEDRYLREFTHHEGNKKSQRYFCIFDHPGNIYEKILDDLWYAELAAGIIPPTATDDCGEKRSDLLPEHLKKEKELQKRFLAARQTLHSIDWKQAGPDALGAASTAYKSLKRAEKTFWEAFRSHEGNRFSKKHCIYSSAHSAYKTILPKLVKAEKEISYAVSLAPKAPTSPIKKVLEKVVAKTPAKKSVREIEKPAPPPTPTVIVNVAPSAPPPPPPPPPRRGGFFSWIKGLFG